MNRITDSALRRIGYSVIAVCLAMAVVAVSLAATAGDLGTAAEGTVISISFLGVTAVAMRSQPRNGAVWSLTLAALFGVLGSCGAQVASFRAGIPSSAINAGSDIPGSPADLDALSAIGINLSQWAWLPMAYLIAIFLLVLFPGGTAPSPRWRRVLWIAAALMTIMSLAGLIALAPWVETTYDELLGGDFSFGDIFGTLMLPLMAFALAAFVNLVRRYRKSTGEERLQFRWFTWALSLYLLTAFVLFTLLQSLGLFGQVLGFVAFANVPLSVGIAITKYRLYNIDVVTSKSLVYGALAAVIGGVYVAIVVGLGSVIADSSLALSITATALVAVVFEPVRVRVQRWANRFVYGDRATPYEVLSDLTGRLAGAESGEGLLERMAERLSEGTGAERAVVWVTGSTDLHAAAAVPVDDMPTVSYGSTTELPGVAVPIEHEGELLGALSVEKGRGDALSPTELRLVEDLAGSAALVLRRRRLDAALTTKATELQESRRRLVDAQDTERRRLERDLHDGAQQQVVALKVKLGLARSLADKDGATRTAALLGQLADDTETAINTMRDFARGVYPPLLEAEGLATAITSQARRAPLPVEVIDEGLGRYPRQIESTVYFCVLEALQNTTKYANARQATVTLTQTDGSVTFSVTDDGDGFDPNGVARGAGLTNMEDRLGAIGGTLAITSAPGESTTVTGAVPAVALVGIDG